MLCDTDRLYTKIIERLLNDLGHEVLVVTDTAATAVSAINSLHPTGVIVDFSADFNSDFDVIATAIAVGATPIVFSQQADSSLLSRYSVTPLVVFKPDITALENAITGLAQHTERRSTNRERRKRPTRVAWGSKPTNVGDSHSFYDALNAAVTGDALASLELGDQSDRAAQATALAMAVERQMRDSDRLLASSTGVRVFLPAGGGDGITSLLARLSDNALIPNATIVRAVTLAPGEAPADAYHRLRSTEPLTDYRPHS